LLPASDDALSSHNASVRRDHGRLALIERAVVVEHDPIADTAEFVRACRVGVERGVIAFATVRVQDWKPCIARGIEAPRRNRRELTGVCFLAILTIHIE